MQPSLSMPAALCGTIAMIAGPVWAASGHIAKPVAECIRDNAAKVEQAVTSLPEAADFLANKLCAAQIATERARAAKAEQDRVRKDLEKRCEADKSKRSNKQHDGAPERHGACEALAERDGPDRFAGVYFAEVIGITPAPADAMSFASKTLLDLRLARLARETPKEAR